MLKNTVLVFAVLACAALVAAEESKTAPVSSTDSKVQAASTDSKLQIPAPAGTESKVVPPAAASTESALAGVSSTESALAGVSSTESALQPPKTSDELLKKWAGVYKGAKTIYMESHISAKVEGPRPADEKEIRVTSAFKRPDILRVDVIGKVALTVYYKSGEITFFNHTSNQYVKRSGQTPEGISLWLARFPCERLATAADPYALYTKDSPGVGELKTDEFGGKDVYEVDLEEKTSGMKVATFFDKTKFYLVGTNAQIPLKQGGGTIQVTEVVDKVLIDELPKGEDGKERDVFSFTLPENATEMKPVPPTPAGTPQLQSTDSKVEGRK